MSSSRSSGQSKAFISTRSMMPLNSCSAPIGICMTSGFAPRRSSMVFDGEEEVSAQLVHLVDEADAGHVVLVGLAPDGLRLGLHALLAVEHRDSTIEHAQRALHLDGEVDVAGGVDDVDLAVVPVAGRRGGRDGDAALLLLLHPVHGAGAIMGLAHLVVHAGVEEDALGRRGFAGIDVSHDADIADLVQIAEHCKCHGLVPFWRTGAGRGAGGGRWGLPRREGPTGTHQR